MLHGMPVIADWLAIQEHRQILHDQTMERTNTRQQEFDYEIGQQVLLIPPGILAKYRLQFNGPYSIEQVHANGTLTIQLALY